MCLQDKKGHAEMSTIVKTRSVKIGNSQGIRIPKAILDQVGLKNDIKLEVQGDQLVLRAARRPREGWDEQFRQIAERNKDELLGTEVRSGSLWDEEEWTWE
jgi:antitoxin MazE